MASDDDIKPITVSKKDMAAWNHSNIRRFKLGQRLQAMPLRNRVDICGVVVVRWTETKWQAGSQVGLDLSEAVNYLIEHGQTQPEHAMQEYVQKLQALRYAVEMEYASYEDEERARLHLGGRVVDAMKKLRD